VTEKSDFVKYRPAVTEVTVTKAAQMWGAGHQVLSLNGKPTAIDAFIVVLATCDGPSEPILLNAVCARELCGLLLSAGYGPPPMPHQSSA